MEGASKDVYRSRVEWLAGQFRTDEFEVASIALSLSAMVLVRPLTTLAIIYSMAWTRFAWRSLAKIPALCSSHNIPARQRL